MGKNIYVVTRYHKYEVLDKNNYLVSRWYRVEKYCFTNRLKAIRYFNACNWALREKAVLRLKKGVR